MNQSKFRIGLVQMTCSTDPEENLAKAEERVRQAAARGAQIVCLQELFRSQYFCREEDARLFDLAEPIPGPSTERLGAVAREQNVGKAAGARDHFAGFDLFAIRSKGFELQLRIERDKDFFGGFQSGHDHLLASHETAARPSIAR